MFVIERFGLLYNVLIYEPIVPLPGAILLHPLLLLLPVAEPTR
jgi:hypothetical protein